MPVSVPPPKLMSNYTPRVKNYNTPPPQHPRLEQFALRSDARPKPAMPAEFPGGSPTYLSLRSALTSKAKSALSVAGTYVASGAAVAQNVGRSLPSDENKQTWGDCYNEWRDGRRAQLKGQEELYLLPGWVVKKQRNDTDLNGCEAWLNIYDLS
jgi:hypothetical protein